MAFGIEDLQKDVQKFQQDIEKAKAKYVDEHTEYINVATELENIGQKYNFLQEEAEAIARIFPEEREKTEETGNTISNPAKGLLISGGLFLGASGISYTVRIFNRYRLVQMGISPRDFQALRATAGHTALNLNSPGLRRILGNQRLYNLANLRLVRTTMAARIAKLTAGVGVILSIVGVALAITSAKKRKEYLEEQKSELKQHLDDFNSYISEANDETKNLIAVFSTYFNEFGIDVDGVFNENQDGFLDKNGASKFDDLVSQLRAALNGAVKGIGELNAATKLANGRINRYLSQGHKGKELIEEVVLDTELPEEVIQRLYVFKLREQGSIVREAIELSQLPEDLVKELYARGYLDDGKTVEETMELSGLTEDQVKRVYVSKLLDDREQLNTENPDDVLDFKGIAEQAGVSEEIVLEIQLRKIAELSSDSKEEELEPELSTR